jgi:glycogen debranching enzyme
MTWGANIFDYDNAFQVGPNRWQVNCSYNGIFLMLTSLCGEIVVDAPWKGERAERIIVDLTPDTVSGIMECVIEEFSNTWHPGEYQGSFNECLASVEQEFQNYLAATPEVPSEYVDARELAAYINWSSVVAPEGNFTRPAMYMSKNWMTGLWTWDHCFNAMALAYHNPSLAWDQLMIPFEYQTTDGALPDRIDDKHLIWNFCKPPIHGWALKWMMDHSDIITSAHLREVYEPFSRWTHWWFNYRDLDQDGIPEYHHGNDSGWDNATTFEAGLPLEGPDLASFLVIQMEALGEIAGRIGKKSASNEWWNKAENLLEKLLAHSWRGDHFIAPRSGDHRHFESQSLFLYLPLILGHRLPKDISTALIQGLTQPGRFITDYGLATESPSSPLYQPDGYWRGPIWAPSTLIIVSRLADCGEKQLARDLSQKFCSMASRSGMAENFNALTGEGLRDPDYTWTSSVFLILAHKYLQ